MVLLALLFVLGVASIVSFAGWVWLVVQGFRKSVGWGLLMFFLAPFAAVVAAIRDWPEWKRPFLLYYGSFVAQVVMIVVCTVVGAFGHTRATEADQAGASAADSVVDRAASRAADHARESQDASPAPTPAPDAAPAEGEAVEATHRARLPMEEIPDHAEPAAANAGEHGIDPTGRPASASMTAHITDPAPAAADPVTTVPDGYEEVAVSTASTRVGSRVRIVGRDGRIHRGTLTEVENGRLHVNFDVSGGSVAMDFATSEIQSLQVPH